MTQFIQEPPFRTPVISEADVVVLGGGPAGIAAACSAARLGAKTILVEKYGFLGGIPANGMVSNFCGLQMKGKNGEVHQIVHGIVDELLDRIRALGGLNTPHNAIGSCIAQSFDISAYKLAADEICLQSGVEILFHCNAVSAVSESDRITELIVESKSGRGAIQGKIFIDCSGDGDLGYYASVPFDKGNSEGKVQYPTLIFRVHNVNNEAAITKGKPILNQLLKEANESGKWNFPRVFGMLFPQTHVGEWRVNITQIAKPNGEPPDGTNLFDLTFAEIEGRRQVENIFRFIKENVPGFENCYLLEIAPQVGIRESRRLKGVYTLTEQDVLGARKFDDSIGVNAWPIENHTKGEVQWKWIRDNSFHQIPFKCLVPVKLDNLLMAGRCGSFTSAALAAVRVSGPCFAMGQAVGTAAALNLKKSYTSRQTDIKILQHQLLCDGVWLG